MNQEGHVQRVKLCLWNIYVGMHLKTTILVVAACLPLASSVRLADHDELGCMKAWVVNITTTMGKVMHHMALPKADTN